MAFGSWTAHGVAVAASAHPAVQWMRLASFYRKAKRYAEMESAVQSGFAAAQHDSHAAVALFNGASVLMKSNRNPALAIKMLEAYLVVPACMQHGTVVSSSQLQSSSSSGPGGFGGSEQLYEITSAS